MQTRDPSQCCDVVVGRSGRVLRCAALVTFVASGVGFAANATAVAGSPGSVRSGRVEGVILSAATRQPVSGAIVRLPQLGMTARSGLDGSFRFARSIEVRGDVRPIRAEISAPGFGMWTISGAPILPNDTLRLHAELRQTPFTHRVRSPEEQRAGPPPGSQPESNYTYTCTGWDDELTPTSTITVLMTQDGNKVETYDFEFYVAHVLPKEWIPSWDGDSLGAGAIAAKTYASYRAMSGHAYSGGDGCADLTDWTSDQVFDPNYSTAATDQAVYATFGSIIWRNGGTFLSQYYAGAPEDKCEAVVGQYAGRMSQWGTQTCALEHEIWNDIVDVFYDSDSNPTTWHYLNQLVLNKSFESDPGMYAWTVTPVTKTARVNGGAQAGDYYLQIDTNVPNKNGAIYQDRSFDGNSTTKYFSSVYGRCDPSNAGKCKITLRVRVTTDSGSTIATSKSFTENRDGVWRSYSYDPAAFGEAHVSVELRIISKQVVGLDAVSLTSTRGP